MVDVSVQWPVVRADDRLNQKLGCLYCSRGIGAKHLEDCVAVQKRVRVRYSFEIEIDRPISWDKAHIEYHMNEGSPCADSVLDDLNAVRKQRAEEGQCMCAAFTGTFVRVVDPTPRTAGSNAKPQRIRLSRKRGFNLQAESQKLNGLPAANVARPTLWGNPYKLPKIALGNDRDSAAKKLIHWFREDLINGALTYNLEDVRKELAGKNLACWCKPGQCCHADVLLELANEAE